MLAVELFATNLPQLLLTVPPVAQIRKIGPVPVPLILNVVPGVQEEPLTAVTAVAVAHVVCAKMLLFAESKKLISTIRVFSSFL